MVDRLYSRDKMTTALYTNRAARPHENKLTSRL